MLQKNFSQRRSFGMSLACAVLTFLSASVFAQTESVLYNFQGGLGDGAYPNGGLVSDAAGNFYGTASGGGSNGTVFELIRGSSGKWNEVTIHSFEASDGRTPLASLVMDARGNLYGTTVAGGNYDAGVVFELQPVSGGTWIFSVLYNFHSDGINNIDGFEPVSTLILDKAGNLYGTTKFGGNGPCFYDGPGASKGAPKGEIPSGCGVVFELSPHAGGSWSERILYNFQGGPDGGLPYAGLVFDHKGTLYGTTFEGGDPSNGGCASYYDGGCGVVFSLSRSGGAWKQNVLYAFQGQSDGANPAAPLILDHRGNLYGTTSGLDLDFNYNSTVFELSPASAGPWTETTILAFSVDGSGTGIAPFAGLAFDRAGNLYGTTYFGGDPTSADAGAAPPKVGGGGVVFKLSPSQCGTWTETLLHSFAGSPDGFGPASGTVLLRKGALFGTTSSGGSANFGTVFKVVP